MTQQRNTYILVINCGSSSLEIFVVRDSSLLPQWSGSISHIGSGHGKLEIKTNQLQVLESRSSKFKNLNDAVKDVISWLKNQYDQESFASDQPSPGTGRPRPPEAELINEQLLKTLDQFVYLAPNHLPDG